MHSETSNNGLSERWTTFVQRTKSVLLIAIPLEIVHLEPPRSGHLATRTTDSQHVPKGQQSIQNNLRERTGTKTASTNHKNIKLLTFVAQIVCPLLCLVDFCPLNVFDRDLLIQCLVGHTPLYKRALDCGCGQPGNPRDRDNLSTTDKSPAPQCVCCSEVSLYMKNTCNNGRETL